MTPQFSESVVSELSFRRVNKTRNRFASLSELLVWGLFLLGLVWAAFIPGRIDHPQWVWLGSAFCGLAMAAIALRFNHLRYTHQRALFSMLLLMVLSIVWLIAQVLVPYSDSVQSIAFSQLDRPSWFTPQFKWSLLPHATVTLVFRDLIVLAAFICTVLLCNSKQRVKLLLLSLLMVGVVHATIAYLAWLNTTHLVDQKALDGHFGAMRGLFINRNHFGGFLVVCSTGALVPILYQIQRLRGLPFVQSVSRFLFSTSVVYALLLSGLIFCVMMSESRAALGQTVLIALVTIFGFRRALTKGHAKGGLSRQSGRLILAFVVLLTIIASTVLLDANVVRRLMHGALLGERLEQWDISFLAIAERPLIGFGGGTYGTVFEMFRNDDGLRSIIYDQAHNQFIHVLLEQGIIGLALFVGVLACSLQMSLSSLANTPSRYRHCLLLVSLAVCFGVIFQSMFDFNLQIVRFRIFFFVFLALPFVLAKYDQKTKRST